MYSRGDGEIQAHFLLSLLKDTQCEEAECVLTHSVWSAQLSGKRLDNREDNPFNCFM